MKKVIYGDVMISEKELVKGSKRLPANSVDSIGVNASIAFNKHRKEIVEDGIFIGNVKTPESDSTFFFLKLPDGTISFGKYKAGNKIFDRISVN